MAHSSRIASVFSRLNPVPAFSPYTGPYKVGTVDVEIPVAELTPCPAPNSDIPTILFRVFYPAVDESHEKPITWLPSPQRQYVSAFTKFMGMGHALSELLSFLPRHLYYASIPVHRNAVMRPPVSGGWPTMLFSHGLGGCRNSYSYLAGSLASHGVVVFCPEHRDGSAIASFVRLPGQNGHTKVIPYASMPHEGSSEVFSAREAQLRIRLWEMALTLDAALAMDAGSGLTNLERTGLQQFAGTLNLDPGSVIFAGHSFGATTVYQLLKSTYYAHHPAVAAMPEPLFTPGEGSMARQVNEKTVTMLLDMWCLPLLGPNSAPLFALPLPLYADAPSAKGGSALLAVESDAFHKWTQHLNVKARLLSPDPAAEVVSAGAFLRPGGRRLAEPNFFYVVDSAHLSQSDFGVLFPWLTKRMFNAVEPERALRLNLRAQLQLLRVNGMSVARTFVGDLIDGAHVDKLDVDDADDDGLMDDAAIFYRSNAVDSWRWIDMVGLGELHGGEKGGLEVAVVP